MTIVIASRKSKLAQIQTEIVLKLIQQRHGIPCEMLLRDTYGDLNLDASLDKIGGKGVFVKDIELLVLNGLADAAVHSMKDVPSSIPDGLVLSAIPKREDARDALILMEASSLMELRPNARIGTGSIRRAAQLHLFRPDIEIVPMRGNVPTRLTKMEQQGLDGVILAAAGLARLGIADRITEYLDPLQFVPAVGQGAIGVENRVDSRWSSVFESLDDPDTRICVEAERAFLRALNGDCHTPIGAYACISGNELYMIGMYEWNGSIRKKDIHGNMDDHQKLGMLLGKKMID